MLRNAMSSFFDIVCDLWDQLFLPPCELLFLTLSFRRPALDPSPSFLSLTPTSLYTQKEFRAITVMRFTSNVRYDISWLSASTWSEFWRLTIFPHPTLYRKKAPWVLLFFFFFYILLMLIWFLFRISAHRSVASFQLFRRGRGQSLKCSDPITTKNVICLQQ